MATVLGKDIQIFAGSSGTTPIIAMAKSCTITGKVDLAEKASATQGTHKEYIAGRDDYEVSLGHLVSAGAPFEGLLKLRGTYTLRIVVGTSTLTGTGICTQAELSAPVGSLATGSVKFKISGGLSAS